jgi:hypothetical protein
MSRRGNAPLLKTVSKLSRSGSTIGDLPLKPMHQHHNIIIKVMAVLMHQDAHPLMH